MCIRKRGFSTCVFDFQLSEFLIQGLIQTKLSSLIYKQLYIACHLLLARTKKPGSFQMFAACNYCFLTLSSPLVKDAVGTVTCLQMDREGRAEGMRILWATAKSAETKSIRLCRESVKPRERKVNSSISTPQETCGSLPGGLS